ncbi:MULTISPECIES: hypothetical protein [Enterobacter cloacae complex]|uniref:hypothetical protein n=1 Tax=Enterobacter cloacae complex TaxID=354276 RepID=UPI001257CAA4|nr:MULTISPECIES: hypothetical protein [Enterobacter cloacae complex]VAL57620.1 Uncharacterised protein [Enterobacter hormaechei]
MNVNTPAAAPMAFFVPSHNAVYDRATQLEGQWVTQREAITLESLRCLYPDAELIPATLVQEKQNDGYRRPWVEITEARYIDQLETLPPEGVWRGVVQIDGVYGRGCDRDFCPVWRAFL